MNNTAELETFELDDIDFDSMDDNDGGDNDRFDNDIEDQTNSQSTSQDQTVENEEESKEETSDTEKDSKGSEEEGEEKDIEDPSSEEVEETIVGNIISALGYDFEDDFEDTEEGIIGLVKSASEKMFNDHKQRLSSSNPSAAQFLEYLENGGDPSRYIEVISPQANYLAIETIDEKNVELQKAVVADELSLKGIPEENIPNILEKYQASGMLHAQSEIALDVLKRDQQKGEENLLEQQRIQREQQQKQIEEIQNTYRNKIKEAREFSGLPIAEKDKDSFTDFITPDPSTGISPYASKIKDFTPEQILTIQYMVYNNFDLGKIVDLKSKTMRAKTLTEKLKNTQTTASSKRTPRDQYSSSIEDLNLDVDF